MGDLLGDVSRGGAEALIPNPGSSMIELLQASTYAEGMPLPSMYSDQNCSLARALEVVGERWTLLIVRDAFYGVHRFGDFVTQLGIPRAILTNRLKHLVEEGVLAREDGERGAVLYRLTDKGEQLWPVLRALMSWGDAHYSPAGPKRSFRHATDEGLIDEYGRCAECGNVVSLPEVRLERGPGYEETPLAAGDPISAAINRPRRLLEPIVASRE
ncbi:winged helix-turn-helix transcriptional regulator [Streptomyces parvulus]